MKKWLIGEGTDSPGCFQPRICPLFQGKSHERQRQHDERDARPRREDPPYPNVSDENGGIVKSMGQDHAPAFDGWIAQSQEVQS